MSCCYISETYVLVQWESDDGHSVVPLSAINKERTKKEATSLKYNDAIFVNDRNGCYKGILIAVGK